MAESFWSTLKIEYYYRHAFRTREEVYERVSHWIETFYNRKRLHSSIGMMPPAEYELQMSQTVWKQAA